MALETVERQDDARKIYGKLASVSWSAKVSLLRDLVYRGLGIRIFHCFYVNILTMY